MSVRHWTTTKCGYRRSPHPSSSEIGGGGLECSDQPIDLGEGVVTDLATKSGKEPEAQKDEDPRSTQVDRSLGGARPKLGRFGNQGTALQ